MATIATSQYLDSTAARTAGEAWTINSGAVLTVRTDTRTHAYAPASMLGSLGSNTLSEGEILWDARNIRWMAFNTGSGTVPAIGTTITQGGTSGYLLGVWASVVSAPTAVGAAMPAAGFIKLREVTGVYTTGILSGITATATSADVAGWMEIALDAAATITVPRLGTHWSRGDRFYLAETNGAVGQTFQIPTNGSTAMYAPGVFIENSPGSAGTDDDYTFWPTLGGATPANNGWAHQHVGEAFGQTDKRQSFVKGLAGGIMQMGEAYQQESTYLSLAAQASTYAGIAHASTYVWANDLVTVYYATGHQLVTGQQTGLDFTTGGATAYDAIYTVTVLDPYRFTVPLAGSGLAGNVTSRPGLSVTFASHLQNIGDVVHCDFTTGSGVDGDYEVYIASTTYAIKYPSITAITAGNASVLHSLTITFTAHNLAVGNIVYLDFTSGAGVDGYYTVKTVVDVNNYHVNFAHSAAITSSNVTMKRTIGHVAPAGCKTWIPNIIVTEVATAARAINTVPNATIASRPEWATTSAGAIDLEYCYLTSGYLNFGQAYSIRLKNCAVWDTLIMTETATALDLEGVNTGMFGAIDTPALTMTSNFAGGLIKRCKFERGNVPASSDHSIVISYCNDTVFDNVQTGIVQYARNSGAPWSISVCNGLIIRNSRSINGPMTVTTAKITVEDLDHCDRYTGRTNATSATYAVTFGTGCYDCSIDGLTFGLGNTIPDCHPPAGIVQYAASQRIKIRNFGTYAAPLSGGTFAPNAYGCAIIVASGGNNLDVKVQRCFLDKVRTAPITNVNSDKGMTYEQVGGGPYVWSRQTILAMAHADLNGVMKGCFEINSVTGQASVYGTHWMDIFTGTDYGRLVLTFTEPTTQTAPQFTMVSGTAKFNSAGGLLMGVIGNQCIWEMPYFAKGHTGFLNAVATMSGGTIANYTLEFQYDIGAGYNGTWLILNGTNLSAITVDPAIGFKLKWRITTITTNTVAITYLRIDTTSSAAGQAIEMYPLDVNTVTFTGLPTGADMVVLTAGTKTILYQVDSYGATSIPYTYSGAQTVDVGFIKPGYVPLYIRDLALTAVDSSLPVTLTQDRNYA